jgi:hypothetical protein
MIVSMYLMPSFKAFTYRDYYSAAVLLHSFNNFMLDFSKNEFGITDLPPPNNPDRTDISDRRNPSAYYLTYFEKYAPLCSKTLGAYQRYVLDYIKDEKGG